MSGDQVIAQLVLASASPRRRELLQRLGVQFVAVSADIDETPLPAESPQDYVQRMALEKAAVVAANYAPPDYAVLAADTTVVVDDDLLGKPQDHFHALAMLARLSGRTHTVMTALCLADADGSHIELVTTEVEFASLSREACEAYLATDEPWDKAGAYAIQGLAGAFVRSINGSYSNVVGLPLCETRLLLAEYGIATALDPQQPGEEFKR